MQVPLKPFRSGNILLLFGVDVPEKEKSMPSSLKINAFAKEEAKEERERIDNLIKELLRPHKTIRDAIHKDVFVTHLETMIIDTSDFQRLRRLKQLGLTNLVYPSANNTRFEHSIGALHVADQIVDKVNRNPYADLIINNEDRFIIRLCALLHDEGNVPYGHTLEDEGGLFAGQWSKDRIKRFLGDASDVAKAILTYPILRDLYQLGRTRFKPENVINEIRETLDAIETKKVENLSRPYIADIVGNTICADLLDYSKRDLYFTGLTSGFDERFLSYVYVTKFNNKDRLVFRLIKPNTRQIRRDVLSEVMDLLRVRYSLAEKVYYQKTKMIASAMLISAVTSMIWEQKLPADKLYNMDDDTLLEYMFNEGTEVAQHLVTHLRERRIYKIVYDLTYSAPGLGRPDTDRKSEIIEELTNPDKRYRKERMLETMSSSSSVIRKSPGAIVIYCPEAKMGAKEIEALVDWGTGKGPLNEIEDGRIRSEINTSIIEKHWELWKMLVLVDPDLPDIERSYVNGDCEELFGLPSASEAYKTRRHVHYIDRHASRYEAEKKVKLLRGDVELIKERLVTRGPERSEVISYDEFCHEIGSMTTNNKGIQKER
jgi:hypothetical protein